MEEKEKELIESTCVSSIRSFVSLVSLAREGGS